MLIINVEDFSLYYFKHSHKKWKDSLETQVILLMFLLELEIFGVVVQSILQNSKKWRILLGIAK